MSPRLLVVAKAPVPGSAKTRLGAVIGMDAAADLAAAALLDTLDAAAAAFPDRCHLALAGDLAQAARGADLVAAVAGWDVFEQQGDGFGERLAHAHATVATHGLVVQIGMDTPQVTPGLLGQAASLLQPGPHAVLGPADDGGWWLLALYDGRQAQGLAGVPMSRADTGDLTRRALQQAGLTVTTTGSLRDVDTVADAAAVAAAAPGTRFAQAWHSLAEVAS